MDEASPPDVRPERLTVFVRGLRLEAEVGVHPHERGRLQPLVVDIALELAPARVRRIAETIDYDALAGLARTLAARGHIDLVETFAQRLADACLGDPRAMRATVRVEKPQAMISAACAGVEAVSTRG